jgi:hypothetical protein
VVWTWQNAAESQSSAKLRLSRYTSDPATMSGMDGGHVLHFARVDFRNDNRLFGIKHEDRFSHVYIIGKTGTGKSTLIETMALQDLERGNGFALIDPRGDLRSSFAQIICSKLPNAPLAKRFAGRRNAKLAE